MIDTIHIAVCMKPVEGNFAQNALKNGVSGLNIDECRVNVGEQPKACDAPGWDSMNAKNAMEGFRPGDYNQGGSTYVPSQLGRWPSNVILDGSDEVEEQFPETKSGARNGKHIPNWTDDTGKVFHKGNDTGNFFEASEGSAARYFKECEPDD